LRLTDTTIKGDLRVTDNIRFDMYPWIHNEQAFIHAFVDGNEIVLQDASGREERFSISAQQEVVGGTGERGSFIFSGQGFPSEYYDVKENDHYVDLSTGKVYKYRGEEWVLSGNLPLLTGPEGPRGLTGPEGPQGEQGIQGEPGKDGSSVRIMGTLQSKDYLEQVFPKEQGDGYLINRQLHVWDGSVWTNVGYIQGPKGDTGKNGSTWHSGTGIPSPLVGVQGDYYLDTKNKNVYRKTGSVTWSLEVNLNGLQGQKGVKGDPGEGLDFYWRGTQLGIKKENDSSYMYRDLRGPKGEVGPKGPEGPQGVQGPIGETGSVGPRGESGKDGIGLDYSWEGTLLGIKRQDEDLYDFRDLQGPAGPQGLTGPQGIQGIQGVQGVPGPTGPVGAQGCPGVGLQFQWNGSFLGVRREDELSYKYQNLQGPAGPENLHISPFAPTNLGVLWADTGDLNHEHCNIVIGPDEPSTTAVIWMETSVSYLDDVCNLAIGPTPPTNRKLIWMENSTSANTSCRIAISEEAPVNKTIAWFDTSNREEEPTPPESNSSPIVDLFKVDELYVG